MPAASDPSASYAAEVARLLWPEPWETPYVTRTRHRPGLVHRDAYLFPNQRRPRLLVPADLRGSSTMIRRLGPGRSSLIGPVRTLVERSVRSRAFRLTRWPMLRVAGTDPGADSIERHLAQCLGADVRVGILLGTRRVNQKPVLQVFRRDGTLLGYAKVGHNELTAALVRREARALATVGSALPHSFRLPRVLHHGDWAGLEVLVISPLPTNPAQAVTASARLAATRELAGLTGTTRVELATSGFWIRLRDSAALLAESADGRRLQAAVDTIEERHGVEQVTFGGWHGDWGRWNMGMGDGVLQLWDWERYDPDVPIGFDGLHFAAQRVRPGARDERQQEGLFLRSVPQTLEEFGVEPQWNDLILRLYLVEMAVRYIDALTYGATPTLLRRNAWVLGLLERLARCPRPTLSEEGP